jgi:hypothetical protein
VQGWVLLKNVQFKHVNMCANNIDEECKEAVTALLKRTNDDFGLTLAGNPIGKAVAEAFVKVAQDHHAAKAGDNVDPQMGLKRVSL